MKRLNNLFSLLFISSLALLVSCGKDEDKLAKQIVVDGEKVSLSNGFITSGGYSTDENGDPISFYYVLLTDAGLTIGDCEAEGEGSFIEIEILSPSTYQLESGTYTFIDDEPELKNTVEGNFVLNYNASTEEADEDFDIKSGTMTISKSGQSFKIKFSNLVLEKESDGSEVEAKGSWEGELVGKVFDCGS